MNNRFINNILVTGGCGFIGSNFIRFLLEDTEFSGRIVNVDKLTYAGNLDNLADISLNFSKDRYCFERLDICDLKRVEGIFEKHNIDTIVHFAAESHVDRSISGPEEFIQTNIMGTFNLLEVARKFWLKKGNDLGNFLFHHVSTDEVYGSLGDTGFFYENTPYDPRSPYSASKASSDHLIRSYFHTYGLPVTLSNCSNNYGPYQFPEKLIPLMILNAIDGKQLPIYGDGKNVRDWLYVKDHCSAIWSIINNGKTGETYNIGGNSEETNINIVKEICNVLENICPNEGKKYLDQIIYVKDRPGHDRRYAINFDKINRELGWSPSKNFEKGLKKTIQWYLDNMEWVNNIKSGEYQNWINKNYGERDEE